MGAATAQWRSPYPVHTDGLLIRDVESAALDMDHHQGHHTGKAGAHPLSGPVDPPHEQGQGCCPVSTSCLVLASGNPRHLAGFYVALFAGASLTPGPAGAITVRLPAGMDMVLYQRSSPGPQLRQGSGLALCLRCAHLEETRQQAMELGAKVLQPVRTAAFGREQWLLDPENNRVLFWEEPVKISGLG